jgi:hypothetical protein
MRGRDTLFLSAYRSTGRLLVSVGIPGFFVGLEEHRITTTGISCLAGKVVLAREGADGWFDGTTMALKPRRRWCWTTGIVIAGGSCF